MGLPAALLPPLLSRHMSLPAPDDTWPVPIQGNSGVAAGAAEALVAPATSSPDVKNSSEITADRARLRRIRIALPLPNWFAARPGTGHHVLGRHPGNAR
jgi:hypothetical protein